jgi:hypothetical protein
MTPIQQWTDNDWTAIGTVVAAIGTVGAFLVDRNAHFWSVV